MSDTGAVPAGSPDVRGQPPEVTLVRHAETEWSLNGRHTGRTDIPLTEHGREVARALGARLGGRRFELVLVSPSMRARETCELCGLGAQARVCEQLLEWHYGDYDGLTSVEIRAARPDWVLWRDGCPGGESPAQVGARADAVIAELSAAAGAVAVFSHGHMLRVLGARWIGLEPRGGALLGLSTAAMCLLSCEHGTPILARWNEASASAL
jgi:broad specificity phosphatase PhoE